MAFLVRNITKAAALCLGVVGLLAVPVAGEARPLGTVTIVTDNDFISMNSSKTVSPWDRMALLNFYDPLFQVGPNGDVVPVLVEKWERPDDNTWRLHLKKNIKFHNGEPLTAEAVKLWVDEAKAPDSRAKQVVADVKEVRVVDDLTIDFITAEPTAYVLEAMVETVSALPPKYYKEVGPQGFAEKPIGTGPYKFVSWRRGDRLTLEANPDYWNGQAKADKVVFWVVPNNTTRSSAVLSGEADIAFNIAPTDVSRIQSSKDLKVETSIALSTLVYGSITLDTPTFKDIRIREAANIAINRKALVERLMRGLAQPMNQLCPPLMKFCYDPTMPEIPYDPERAKKLIAESGLKDLPVTLHATQSAVPLVNEVLQVISSDLQRVGFTPKIQIEEYSVFSAKIYDTKNNYKDVGNFVVHPINARPGGQSIIKALFETGGPTNWIRYSNPDIDRMFGVMKRNFDEEGRKKDFLKITHAMRDEWTSVYLYNFPVPWAVNKRIKWQPRTTAKLQEMEAAN